MITDGRVDGRWLQSDFEANDGRCIAGATHPRAVTGVRSIRLRQRRDGRRLLCDPFEATGADDRQ
jgi:hypothetical protein